LIDDLRARHERYYRGLGTFATFGRGWLARLDSRHTEALAILTSA
jgi:lysozyme family protein